jgi:hypothetical protein
VGGACTRLPRQVEGRWAGVGEFRDVFGRDFGVNFENQKRWKNFGDD